MAWVLRSQLGCGPLALLALHSFTLPEQIFSADAKVTGNSDGDTMYEYRADLLMN
jgi:type VI secretion system protein ImpL